MKTNITRFVAVGVAMCTTLLSSGGAEAQSNGDCKPMSVFSTITPGVLKIVAPDAPPYFTYKNSVFGGFEGEFLARFAKDNCLHTEVVILPPGSVIEAVKNGQGDVGGGGWTPTAQRGEFVGQTNALLHNPIVSIGYEPSADLDNYKEKTVGTVVGYVYNSDLEAWAKAIPATIKVYDSPDAGFADVRTKRLAVLLLSAINANFRLGQFPTPGLSAIEVKPHPNIKAFSGALVTNIVHTKSNSALTNALNAEITAVRADGTLKQILERNGIPASLIPAASPAEAKK